MGKKVKKSNEFVENLENLQEIKDLKKIKKKNLLVGILLTLPAPFVFSLGLFFHCNAITIISIIILGCTLIYIYINKNKCRKVIKSLTIEKVREFFATNYEEIMLTKEKQEELSEEKIKIFSRNMAIEKNCEDFFYTENYESNYFLCRFKKEKKVIDLYFSEDTEYSGSNNYIHTMHVLNFILVTKVPDNEIMYLKTIPGKKNDFESNFLNCEKEMREILEGIDQNSKKDIYIKLTDAKKERLLQILNKNLIDFSIIIKDGEAFIKAKTYIKDELKCLEKIEYIQNCLSELLTELLEW